MSKDVWDLCVIGAGPGGYAAAVRAHDLGKRVALVERGPIGGAGIHAGALSSKTLWHLSNDYVRALRVDRGYRATGIEMSYAKVMESVGTALSERRALLERQLEQLASPSDAGGEVRLVRGTATFVTPHAVEVTGADGQLERIEARNFVIATGSRPRRVDGIEVDGEVVVTSDQVEGFPRFPGSMVIVGAGVIGCEYATIFMHFGRTKLHLIDRAPRILPFEDDDVAEVVATNFEAAGIHIHRESKLEELKVRDGAVEYIVTNETGATEKHRVDKALVSVGRVPRTDGLGLEVAGVALDEKGGVTVEGTRTSVSHIHAVGDTTINLGLVNVAELEGRYAVETMFGLSPRPIHYDALSTIMFLDPEIACVGLNEIEARKKGIPYRVGVVGNRLISRNVAMRETRGLVKLLVCAASEKILGMRVVGPEASATVPGVAYLIDMGVTIEEVEHCAHPHPSIPEGVQECARLLLGRSIMKLAVFGPEGLLRRGEG